RHVGRRLLGWRGTGLRLLRARALARGHARSSRIGTLLARTLAVRTLPIRVRTLPTRAPRARTRLPRTRGGRLGALAAGARGALIWSLIARGRSGPRGRAIARGGGLSGGRSRSGGRAAGCGRCSGEVGAPAEHGLGGREHHGHVAPLLRGRLLDYAELGDLLREAVEDGDAALGVGDLAAAEHDRDLDLVLVT